MIHYIIVVPLNLRVRMASTDFSRPSPRADGIAAGLSLLCLVHCLGLPLAIAMVPALASALSLPETVHLGLFLLAVPASAVALLAGYRHHGAMLPALFGGLGLALLGIGALAAQSELQETGFTVVGSMVLAGAHLRNWRLRLQGCPRPQPR
jgi:hypothetical protein